MNEKYFEANKQLWNAKTPIHLASEMYNMPAFRQGKTSLKDIEIPLLGDVKGKKILHLQCHFGQDSLSLARMGAKVTGVDISDHAIQQAQTLNEELGLDAEFVCCNVLELDQHLDQAAQFDIVFTSYGAIPWLPELTTWARLIRHYLKPQGQFIFVELHPVVWTFNHDFTQIEYPYFNESVIAEEEEGTYADFNADIKGTAYSWNHPLQDVFGALLQQQLRILDFQEYNYSPYNCLPNMYPTPEGNYQLENIGSKLPMAYSIVAQKER